MQLITNFNELATRTFWKASDSPRIGSGVPISARSKGFVDMHALNGVRTDLHPVYYANRNV